MELIYRGVTIRVRHRKGQPHGWWILPEGPLEDHPDRGWVLTREQARAEVDSHIARMGCLMRRGGRWLGILADPETATSLFELTHVRGFSAWCAARQGRSHEPCSTRRCPCACHQGEGQRESAEGAP